MWLSQVQKNDNAIYRVNCYTVDGVVSLVNQYLSSHWTVIDPIDSDSRVSKWDRASNIATWSRKHPHPLLQAYGLISVFYEQGVKFISK